MTAPGAAGLQACISFFVMALAVFGQPAPSFTVEHAGRTVTFDAAGWAKLPRVKVNATDHGEAMTFEGVPLRRILSMAGVPAGSTLRGEALRLVVRVEGADGYQAVFALAEIDPGFRERNIIVADRRDGAPLPADVGPFQVVVPDENRGARWVRQVTKIVVFSGG